MAALISASYLTSARGADVYWDINGSGALALGDYNSDGKVDSGDYVISQNQHQRSSGIHRLASQLRQCQRGCRRCNPQR